MEAKKCYIQIFKFGLEGCKFFFNFVILSFVGDNHKKGFAFFWWGGWEKKPEKVLVKENFELEKIWWVIGV